MFSKTLIAGKHSSKSLAQRLQKLFSAKELSFGMDARAKMILGCDKLADAV